MKVALKGRFWGALVLIAALGLVARFLLPSPGATKLVSHDGGSGPPSHASAHKDNPVGEIVDLFKTPIELHGRVEDQHGKPIAGAKVELFPLDNPSGGSSHSNTVLTSDANGGFSIKGLHGISMGVLASKEGFIHLPPLDGPASSANVGYAFGGRDGKRYSNPKTPLVLRLQNPGRIEPLVCVRHKRWRIGIDGKPALIALDSEEGKGPHQIEFRLWSNNQVLYHPGVNPNLVFDWTFEARVPGGGFIWSDSNLDFEVPESGYKEMLRYHFPADMPQGKWKNYRHGRYFVKFPDNTYGRIQFEIDATSNGQPLYMQTWFNPKPESRNLASEIHGPNYRGGDPDKEQ